MDGGTTTERVYTVLFAFSGIYGVLPSFTREVQHPGNHKYAWALDPTAERLLPPSLPYPRAPRAVCGVVDATCERRAA